MVKIIKKNVITNYIICSLNHERYFQKVKKSTLSLFDDKKCYIHNNESKPWG